MPLFQKCCSDTRMKYVDIASIGNVLGGDVCEALLGMHAITGCDTVSRFSRKRQLLAFQLVKKNISFQEHFARFGLSCEFSDADFTKLQILLAHCMVPKSQESDVSTHWYQLFSSKQAQIERHKLPSCAD